jgi:hypothetical protein
MRAAQGTQAIGTHAPILRLSLMVLGLSLFFAGAARADTWSAGAVVTYNQSEWGDSTTAGGMLLNSNYDSVYASAGDEFVIGSRTPGFFMVSRLKLILTIFFRPLGLQDHWTRTSQIQVPAQQEFSEAKWLQ